MTTARTTTVRTTTTRIRTARALVVAIALIAGAPAADAQGWGSGPASGAGGYGPGWRQSGGPCTAGQSGCRRIQDPEKHAACRAQANDKGLRAGPRRAFMTDCMTR